MKIRLFEKEEHYITCEAGEAVFRENDPGDCMFVVIEGAVDIIIKGNVLETVDEGGVFGEMSLIENTPRTAAAIAKVDSKLVRIDRDRFMFLIQQTPFFALQLMTIMAQRLRRMDELI